MKVRYTMRRYYAVITNSRSTSNPFGSGCNLPLLYIFTSKEERDEFVKIHTNDLENAFSVCTSIVRKYYKDYIIRTISNNL
jgi:hypothetical protein